MAKQPEDRSAAPHAEPSMGASDANNGGGSGAGIADAETTLRVGDPAPDADRKADRERLFPGSAKSDERQSDVRAADLPAPNGT